MSLGIACGAGNHFVNNAILPNTEAQRTADLLKSRFPRLAGDTDQIAFHARAGKLSDPGIRARVDSALAAVARLPHVTGVVSPYASPHAVSRAGTIGFATVAFDQRGDALPSGAVKRVISLARSARSSGCPEGQSRGSPTAPQAVFSGFRRTT